MRKGKVILAVVCACVLALAIPLVACGPVETGPKALYTVAFETDGGTKLPAQGVYEGEKAVRPADPEKAGYDFGAWYKDEALSDDWDFDADTVSADTTLYAKWALKPVTEDKTFYYGYNADGETYRVWAKNVADVPETLVLPSEKDGVKVTAVAENGFSGAAVQTLVIPGGITGVERQAFRNCASLTTILGAEHLTNVGSYAFFGTGWLDAQPNGMVYLGTSAYTFKGTMISDYELTLKEGTTSVSGAAFEGQSTLAKVNFPATVAEIGAYAFAETGIKEVTIPGSVKSVGTGAFRNTASLVKAEIAADVPVLGGYTFAGSSVREVVYHAANAETNDTFAECEQLASVTFGDTVERIPAGIFGGCTGLTTVKLGNKITEIPANLFRDCTLLSAIEFPAKLTVIGDSAFRNTGITQLTIPAQIEEIGGNAFADCAALASVRYEAVNAVAGDRRNPIFANCPQLTSAVIAEGVTDVPASLFQNAGQLASVSLSASVERIGSRAFYQAGVQNALVIPNSVKSIGKMAFAGNARLKAVTIGEGVEEIGSNAFANCTRLRDIFYNAVDCKEYPYQGIAGPGSDNVLIFGYCTAIENVTFGDKVETIPRQFLYRQMYGTSTKVASITLPASLKRIGQEAFYYNQALTEVNAEAATELESVGYNAFEATPWRTALTGSAQGAQYLGKTLYYYKRTAENETAVVVKDGTRSISGNAFQYASWMESIVLPEGITDIEKNAFIGCSKLEELQLPSTVEKIGDDAFSNCSALKTVNLPEGLTHLGYGAFRGCRALTSIAFPESLKSLGDSAFSDTRALTTVQLNHTLTSIPQQSFIRSGITDIEIPANIVEIQAAAFNGYKGTTLTIPGTVRTIGNQAFYGASNLTSLTIGDGVQTIGNSAFVACGTAGEGLKEIVLPDSVVQVGSEAFAQCTKLERFTFSKGQKETGNRVLGGCTALASVTIPEGVEVVGSEFVIGCKSLQSVEFPASIKELYASAFLGADRQYNQNLGLTRVVVPESITKLPEKAFSGCKSLTEVILPQTLTEIGGSAFSECVLLSEIELPDSLTKIGSSAFSKTAFKKIRIPAGVRELSTATFSSCANLTVIELSSEEPPMISGDPFSNTYWKCFVPAGSVERYRDNGYWAGYKDRVYAVSALSDVFAVDNGVLLTYFGEDAAITLPDTVSSIALGALPKTVTAVTVNESNPYLKEENGILYSKDGTVLVRYDAGKTDAVFTLPEGVTEIAPYAFMGETDLTEIDLSKVVRLGEGAFYGCSKLANVTLNETLTELPDFVFYNCAKITSIAIPDTVKRIGDSALYGARLTALTLPAALEAIGNRAFFSYYNAFAELTIPAGVTEIGDFAFQSNGQLFNVFFEGNTPPVLIGAKGVYSSFLYTRADLLLIVPNGEAYRSAESWKTYAGRVVSESAFTRGGATIENDVLYRNDGAGTEGVYVIPDEITRVGNGAFFRNAQITELTVGKGVRNIDAAAFAGMTKLAAVHFNAIQIASGDKAFASMSSIKTVTIGGEVTVIPAGLFDSCSGIIELTVPESVREIGSNAFNRASALKTLNYNAISAKFMDTVNGAFNMASQLTTVNIGAAVKALPDSFLNNVNAVTAVTFAEGNALKEIGAKAFYGLWRAVFTGIPATVESYGESAFYNCQKLEGPLDLSAARSFGPAAFQSCAKLSFTNIPSIKEIPKALFSGCKLLTDYDFTGVESVGESAFYNSGLTQAVLPETVESIGYAAFSGTAITSVTVPGSVKFLDNNVFANCASLTEAAVSEGVTELPNAFFSGCAKLASVTLPESLTKIGKQAFMRCTALTEITLPASVTEIGQSAFVRSGLTAITLRGAVPPALTTPVFTVSDTLRIIVPKASLALYQEEWGDYADYIVAAQE